MTAPKPVGQASPGAAMAGILVTRGPVGMILAEITGSNPATGSGRYYAHDNIQSTRGVYDDSAASLGAFEYTPFGSAFASGGPADLTHRFTGLDLDRLTGQYYAPYRYYDPTTARWLTRDPLDMVDGPNVYGYVKGKPIVSRDPTGLIPWNYPNACEGDPDWTDCAIEFALCRLAARAWLYSVRAGLGALETALLEACETRYPEVGQREQRRNCREVVRQRIGDLVESMEDDYELKLEQCEEQLDRCVQGALM